MKYFLSAEPTVLQETTSDLTGTQSTGLSQWSANQLNRLVHAGEEKESDLSGRREVGRMVRR